MISDKRLDKDFVLLKGDTTVKDALARVTDPISKKINRSYLIVDVGTNAAPKYQVFVARALIHLPKTQKIQDAKFGFRKTAVVSKRMKVGEANDMALTGIPVNLSLIVVDTADKPMGVFILKGHPLIDEPEAGPIQYQFDIICPTHGKTSGSFVSNGIRCIKGDIIIT